MEMFARAKECVLATERRAHAVQRFVGEQPSAEMSALPRGWVGQQAWACPIALGEMTPTSPSAPERG